MASLLLSGLVHLGAKSYTYSRSKSAALSGPLWTLYNILNIDGHVQKLQRLSPCHMPWRLEVERSKVFYFFGELHIII